MSIAAALIGFGAAAAVLTMTPGVDTMLVVRSRIAGGRRQALAAAAGIVSGCLCWGTAAALGLGTLLHSAPIAYVALRWSGALYLLACGALLLVRPRHIFAARCDDCLRPAEPVLAFFRRGFLTNILNPKVALFYLAFLPPFVPAGASPGPFMVLLALLHAVMGLAWLSSIAISLGPITHLMKGRVVAWIDRLAGVVFIGFGLKLALSRT